MSKYYRVYIDENEIYSRAESLIDEKLEESLFQNNFVICEAIPLSWIFNGESIYKEIITGKKYIVQHRKMYVD